MAKPVSKRVPNVSTATVTEVQTALIEASRKAEWEKEKKKAERKCDACGKTYHPSRRWQTYCSAACRVSAFQVRSSNAEMKLLERIQDLEKENTELKQKLQEKV